MHVPFQHINMLNIVFDGDMQYQARIGTWGNKGISYYDYSEWVISQKCNPFWSLVIATGYTILHKSSTNLSDSHTDPS